jgi:Serine hydrolase (FSH1)
MRFLCLHGMGTNSHVFEMQTAALRYELGDHHTYEFVEGTIETPIAPELKGYLSTSDTYFAYFNQNSLSTCRKALSDLETFIQTDGPFDGVMAFSQGAALASTLIVKKFLQDPRGQTLSPIFKCAIFISGGIPCSPISLSDPTQTELRLLDARINGECISIPTTCIWGAKDLEWPPELAKLCKRDEREVFVHDGGHEVPGSSDIEAVRASVRAVRRTVDRALHRQ